MSTIELLKTKYPSFLQSRVVGGNNDRVVVSVGRQLWPALFVAGPPSKGETNPKKFQYSNNILVPAEADISELQDFVQKLFEEHVLERQRKGFKWRSPIEPTADSRLADMADEYPFIIKANKKQWQKNGTEMKRPDVFDGKKEHFVVEQGEGDIRVYHKGKLVKPADVAYMGRWSQIVVQPYWYPPTQGMPGVSLGLLSTQLLWHDKDDTPIAGGNVNTAGDFEVVEGLDETPEVDEYA